MLMTPPKSGRVLGILVVFIVAMIISSAYSTGITAIRREGGIRYSQQAAGESWLSGWSYRKSHVVEGASGAGSHYNIKLKVNHGTGTDAAGSVFCNGLCQPDFDDIRFTASDGETLLDYWTQESSYSDYAYFWVEVSESLDTDTSIFVYYGNSGVSSVSDGTSTFLFFDDFENGWNTEKWSEYHGGVVVSSGEVVLEGDTEFENRASVFGRTYLSSGVSYHSRAKWSDTLPTFQRWCTFTDNWSSTEKIEIYGTITHGQVTCLARNDEVQTYDQFDVSSPTSYHEYSFDYAADRVDFYQDSTLLTSISSNIPDEPLVPHLGEGNRPGSQVWVDWVFAAKWMPSGPSHGAWGPQQTETGTPPTTQTTTTIITPPPLLAPLVAGGLASLAAVVGGFVYSRRRKEGLSTSEEDTTPLKALRVPREVEVGQSVAIGLAAERGEVTPTIIDRTDQRQTGTIEIASGFDAVGEDLKLAVKIRNNSELIITDLKVILDVPSGFEFVKGTDSTENLGNIVAGGFQSAIFWLKPLRCVDGEYGGSVVYRDARGQQHVVEIPEKRLINICPMLTSTERADEVFARLKSGS
ncbi:DUF2341 domain-containing protein, partial [Candidatus Thorarchaeota archaeon]